MTANITKCYTMAVLLLRKGGIKCWIGLVVLDTVIATSQNA